MQIWQNTNRTLRLTYLWDSYQNLCVRVFCTVLSGIGLDIYHLSLSGNDHNLQILNIYICDPELFFLGGVDHLYFDLQHDIFSQIISSSKAIPSLLIKVFFCNSVLTYQKVKLTLDNLSIWRHSKESFSNQKTVWYCPIQNKHAVTTGLRKEEFSVGKVKKIG